MLPPEEFLYDGEFDWLLVHKEVSDMFAWAVASWNPDKGANIGHKTCGYCPCDRPALTVKVAHRFMAPIGYREDLGRDTNLFFGFHYLKESNELKERSWNHEFGHVLGFRHEHQRPDLWDDDNPTFKLNIQFFPGYSNFFECEHGRARGKLIPPETVREFNGRGNDLYPPVKEGDRYDFYWLTHSFRYARLARAVWADLSPLDIDACGWDMQMAHGRGGIGADPVLLRKVR